MSTKKKAPTKKAPAKKKATTKKAPPAPAKPAKPKILARYTDTASLSLTETELAVKREQLVELVHLSAEHELDRKATMKQLGDRKKEDVAAIASLNDTIRAGRESQTVEITEQIDSDDLRFVLKIRTIRCPDCVGASLDPATQRPLDPATGRPARGTKSKGKCATCGGKGEICETHGKRRARDNELQQPLFDARPGEGAPPKGKKKSPAQAVKDSKAEIADGGQGLVSDEKPGKGSSAKQGSAGGEKSDQPAPEGAEGGSDAVGDPAASLEGMPDAVRQFVEGTLSLGRDAAKASVRGCEDAANLQGLLSVETRASVKSAARGRLRALGEMND